MVGILVIDGIWPIKRWFVLLCVLQMSRKTSADRQTGMSTCHFSWTEWLKSIDSAFCSIQWATEEKKPTSTKNGAPHQHRIRYF